MNGADIIKLFNLLALREPLWLLLAFAPLTVWWFRLASQPKQASFADAHLMPWIVSQQHIGIRQRLLSKNSAFLIAWLLFAIAASGPRLPIERVTQEQATDMDIMLVVDVSRSMRVTDISPSRLRRAQIEIEELLEHASKTQTGKRIGVIVFAAHPHLLVPLTSDHEALRFYLRSLDSLVLPTNGSEPAAALELAHKELNNSENPSSIIMFTDGDFSTFPDSAITTLSQARIPLYILGIGSAEGDAIPLKNGKWLQHEGRPVISRLNEETLRKIANFNDGKNANGDANGDANDNTNNNYSPALDDDSDWRQLYDEGIASLSTSPEDINDDHNIIWQELYHWPLFSALILLWLSLTPYGFRLHSRFSIDTPIYEPDAKVATSATAKSFFLAFTLILFGLYPQHELIAANTAALNNDAPINENQAFKNYSNSNFPAALEIYKQLPGYSARLGEGSSLYKMSDYSGAIQQYTQAVLAANNDSERAAALFNLGNSYFQTGNYVAALTVYKDASKYRPGHKNILHNLKFTRSLKKAVDARLQQTTLAARMGSGPQRAATSNAIENNQRSSLSISERENMKPKEFPLPEFVNISNTTLERLINKGLNQIKLAAENITSIKHTRHKRSKLDFINAHLRMTELEDQQALLWKQLFEIEEGFPAPLTKSRQIPGVTPW